MKWVRGVLSLAFGVFCLLGVILFASGAREPPPGQTVGPANYVFGLFVAAAAFLYGSWEIKEAIQQGKGNGQDRRG